MREEDMRLTETPSGIAPSVTMIERVAEAIYDNFFGAPGDTFVDGSGGAVTFTWATAGPTAKDAMLRMARSAIEAMREPTDAMIVGACAHLISGAEAAHAFGENCQACRPLWHRDFHRTMVNAALSEDTTPVDK